MKFVLQSSDAPENCCFTRWVDLTPIDSVQEFIEYLQIKIFDLECKVNHYEEVSEGNKDDEAPVGGRQAPLFIFFRSWTSLKIWKKNYI